MKKPVFGETNLDFRQGAENIPNRNALKMVVSLECLWCSCGNSLNTLPFFPWCSTLDATKTRKKNGVVPWIESDRDRSLAESDMTVMLAFRGVELPSARVELSRLGTA